MRTCTLTPCFGKPLGRSTRRRAGLCMTGTTRIAVRCGRAQALRLGLGCDGKRGWRQVGRRPLLAPSTNVSAFLLDSPGDMGERVNMPTGRGHVASCCRQSFDISGQIARSGMRRSVESRHPLAWLAIWQLIAIARRLTPPYWSATGAEGGCGACDSSALHFDGVRPVHRRNARVNALRSL
jgi:hypothetical protein